MVRGFGRCGNFLPNVDLILILFSSFYLFLTWACGTSELVESCTRSTTFRKKWNTLLIAEFFIETALSNCDKKFGRETKIRFLRNFKNSEKCFLYLKNNSENEIEKLNVKRCYFEIKKSFESKQTYVFKFLHSLKRSSVFCWRAKKTNLHQLHR